ncbi:hypothetical protein G3M81_12490 [Bacillus paralicheniformis]|uniref:hypothetical protein n=1 Tax=Bacillus TaxID=1386 RepID=UPI0013EEEDC4|nr:MULTISPECIES: hypothetical protein [Bacillus]MCY8609922.1 hypothetical protein [Bacillus haynesii]MEC0752157.1 hypothetical protein [Bacillus haynesii]QII49508.1 hypothetical protein G3M81_12490 [Bacillus paralicheniformis]
MNKSFNMDKTPCDWDMFLAEATDLFVEKDVDYNSRFMRGMLDLDAKTLWSWEVDKKIDRIRTWIKRGELQVKGEGVTNSVVDLFNYTVQYFHYSNTYTPEIGKNAFMKLWENNRERFFYKTAYNFTINEWIQFLISNGRISENEKLVILVLRAYMGDRIIIEDYKQAIRSLFS